MNQNPKPSQYSTEITTLDRRSEEPKPFIRCDYCKKDDCCKKDGHRREECWCLHPNLRLKVIKRSGFKGEDRRQGERPGDKAEERKGYAAQAEEKRGCAVQNENPSANGEMNMDQMWQMLQQLTVMLTLNINKASGVISNLSQINLIQIGYLTQVQ
jgi:hypothetical protein